jgi:hypothetical protein
MTRKLHLLPIVALLVLTSTVHAQYASVPVLVPGSVGFPYGGRGLKVAGFLSTGAPVGYVPVGPGGVILGPPVHALPAYGVMERRFVIQQVLPAPRPRELVPDYDLSGIDLDVHTPDHLYPPGTAPAPAKPPARLVEAKKQVEPAKLPQPPAPPEPPVVKPPVDGLLQPRAGAAEEARRLVDLGLRSFREQAFGLAVFRFQQASEVDPANARAFFLLGQAFVAVGQYRDAAQAIQDGLKLQPDWPTGNFRPRTELYDNAPDDWLEHRRRLDDAVKRQPANAAFAFLRAYVAWFDGERVQAAEWFQAARPLAPDPRWIDLFH